MHKCGIMSACGVCPSVRLTRSWIMSKRITSTFFQHPSGSHTILVFFHTKRGCANPTGTPLTGASNARGYDKMTIFDQYLALSQKRLQLDGHMQRDNL